MKTSTNLLLASAVVVVLMVSALGGVTYSWFSDSETYDVEIGTANVDLECNLEVNGTQSDGKTVSLLIGTNNIILTVNNNGTAPVEFDASFTVPRYSAYSNGDFSSYVGELKPSGNSYTLDKTLTTYQNGGQMANSIKAISASFYNEKPQTLGGTSDGLVGNNTNLGQITIEGGTAYHVLYCEYSAEYSSILLPGAQVRIPITVVVGENYTRDSILNPFIEVNGIQANANLKSETVMIENGNATFKYIPDSGITQLVFQDNAGTSIVLDWQALRTPGLDNVSISISKTAEGITVKVGAKNSSSANITLNGLVEYSIPVTTGGITSVLAENTPVPCLVINSNGTTTVSFTDSASNTTHTIGLVNQS